LLIFFFYNYSYINGRALTINTGDYGSILSQVTSHTKDLQILSTKLGTQFKSNPTWGLSSRAGNVTHP